MPTNRLLPFARATLALFTALGLAGCPSSGNNGDGGTMDSAGGDATMDGSDVATPSDGSDTGTSSDASNPDGGTNPADCDPLDEHGCALPWPSNLYLVPDSARATGYTLTFGATSLPKNTRGHHVNPAPYSRMDGYGVGVPIMAVFPNLDVTNIPDETRIEASLAADAQVLLFKVGAGNALTRVPYWAELDSHEADLTKKLLFVRPAVLLEEGTRYIVAFRNLHDTTGAAITPSPAFVALRDGTAASDPLLAPRQARFNDTFTLLQTAGVDKSTLTLAWDFNTASSAALHGTMLRMRDDSLAAVGTQGPTLTVQDVTEFVRADDGSGRPVDDKVMLELHGIYDAPNYMFDDMAGSLMWHHFQFNADGTPMLNGTTSVEFWARVPWSAADGTPHGILQYGHGLLGDATEIETGWMGDILNNHHLIAVAASLTGMSSADLPVVLQALQDLSLFQHIGDGLHQGLLQWLLLTRAAHAQMATLPALTSHNVVVNSNEVFYSGNSQGGIFGGSFLALSQDVTYGHLGVPGNNYATMLHRSHDFDRFLSALTTYYRNTTDQAICIASMQLLWDATDPVSYARHITAEPFPNTPVHYAYFTPAKGDHQVAVISNEVLARSNIGIALMANYDDERTPALITQQPFPYNGSGIVLWDFGNPWPPPGNEPPNDTVGDPHESPRRSIECNNQMDTFFRTHQLVDVCGGDGCHPN